MLTCDLNGKGTLYLECPRHRLPDSEFANKANEALNIIDTNEPEVVFLGDDNALKYLGNRLADHNCLTIYYGINDNPRSVLDANGLSRLTGIVERPLIKRGVATA